MAVLVGFCTRKPFPNPNVRAFAQFWVPPYIGQIPGFRSLAGIAFIACAVALFDFGWPKIGGCAVIAGIGMIVLSMVLPGNERWILGGFVAFFVVASAALLIGWSKGKDENRNHVPDWVEALLKQLKGGSK